MDAGLELGLSRQALVSDADGDGIPDSSDNCPRIANPNQANSNGVGPGDACELALVLSSGILNQYARFQSHKELVLSFAPFEFTFGPDLMRLGSSATAPGGAFLSLLSLKLGVRSSGELAPGYVDTISGAEMLSVRVGSDGSLGGAKASDAWLRLDGTATVTVSFYDGNTALGTVSLSSAGTTLTRVAPSSHALFDRIELRASAGRISLKGPNEGLMFALAQAQLACPSGYQRVGSDCVDINECAGLNHVCDVLTTCTNTPGSFTCGPCPSGYRGTGNTSCLEVNECAEGTAQCSPLVSCSNTAGSYQCGACPAGYQGDGHTCTDIDECADARDICDPLVTCTNLAGSYQCGSCPSGYTGGGERCVDIDECSGPQRVCDQLVTCTNVPGSYRCGACPAGYRGDGQSCVDIDECSDGSAQCSPLVVCGNTLGSYQCGTCPSGYQGDGRSCSDIDECADGSAPCAANVTCMNTVGSYTCGACPSGFSGDGHTCVDIDECINQPCDSRASCTNTIGSYTCGACPAGFRGDGHVGCVDIDECAEDRDDCSPLVTCGNTLGGYQCSPCPAGYSGDGHSCADIDECAAHTALCDAHVTCTNTPGNYTCGQCPTGFTGNGYQCTDIDECTTDPCDLLTACTNTEGSYACTACPAGYAGDGYAGCVDVDECAVNRGDCPESEACVNTPGSHQCLPCASGSVGSPTHCGVGACASSGVTTCVRGEVKDTCVPGQPAANDAICDGLDEDCDGSVDEEVAVTATSCGLGACASTGTRRCASGQMVDSCTPGTAASTDASCDGSDEDCDGVADEDYTPATMQCGVGACLRSGVTSCSAGVVASSCVAGTPSADDATCDGLDQDCNGSADEDYVPAATSCGFGLCAAQGAVVCQQGTVRDTCVPGGNVSVVCPAPDACHDVGTCDPQTGACANATKSDGSPCSNGNACDGEETCQQGTCTGGLCAGRRRPQSMHGRRVRRPSWRHAHGPPGSILRRREHVQWR